MCDCDLLLHIYFTIHVGKIDIRHDDAGEESQGWDDSTHVQKKLNVTNKQISNVGCKNAYMCDTEASFDELKLVAGCAELVTAEK